MRSPETSFDGRCLLAHLGEELLVRLEAELRDETESTDEPQRVLAEALRRDRAEAACFEIGAAAERVEDLARLEPAGHRVDSEVAALHVLGERQLGVGDDLEVVPARAGGHLLARRRELDSRGRQPPDPSVAWEEPDAHQPVGDHEIFHAAVWSQCRAELVGVDAQHEEVRILRVEPEQLVAHGAADQVGVQAQRADVLLDLLHRRRKRYAFPPDLTELSQRESVASRWFAAS